MSLSRTVSLGVLTAIASAWAVCLTVPGFWLVCEGPSDILPIIPLSPTGSRILGVLAIAMGNFVFMTFVADRVFPSVMRRQTVSNLEMFMIGVMLTSFLLLLLRVVGVTAL